MEQERENTIDGLIPSEVQEALQSIENGPGKQTILTYLSSISMIAPISPQLEMVKKIEPEHISKIIDLDAQRLKHEEEIDKRLFENAQKIRQHELTYAIVFGIFILILVFTLKDNPTLLLDFMKIAFGAIGGLGFGYYKGKKDSNSNE